MWQLAAVLHLVNISFRLTQFFILLRLKKKALKSCAVAISCPDKWDVTEWTQRNNAV